VGLFTINFELGDKTLETLTRISSTSVIRFELGPETRAMIKRLASSVDGITLFLRLAVRRGARAALSGGMFVVRLASELEVA
jgi:hypothetical protein